MCKSACPKYRHAAAYILMYNRIFITRDTLERVAHLSITGAMLKMGGPCDLTYLWDLLLLFQNTQ